MSGKIDEIDISKNNFINAIQVCLFVIALIKIYYDPNIPSDSKPVIMLGIGGLIAIVFIKLEIDAIQRELISLKKRRKY